MIIDPVIREKIEKYDEDEIGEELILLELYQEESQQLLTDFLERDMEIDQKIQECLERIESIVRI